MNLYYFEIKILNSLISNVIDAIVVSFKKVFTVIEPCKPIINHWNSISGNNVVIKPGIYQVS